MIRVETRDEGWDGFVGSLVADTLSDGILAVSEATQHLRLRVIERLTGDRSGREYPVPGTKAATRVASAPGQAPASLRGKLRQNINAPPAQRDGDVIVGAVGVDLRVVPYARRLEYGGVHVQARDQAVRGIDGWFMVRAGTVIRTLPRPYLRPTFDAERDVVERMMERRLNGR